MTDRPLVVHIIDELPPNGAERLLVDLIKARSDRFDVQVLCLVRGGPLEQELARMGVPVVIFGRRSKFDVSLLWRLWRWLRLHRPKVVHTHLFTADSWGRLAAFLAGVPAVFSTAHSSNQWKSRLHITIDRLMARVTSKVIACTEAVQQVLITEHHIPAKKVALVGNGIDFQRLENADVHGLTSEFPTQPNVLKIGIIGRLHPCKGHLDFLPVLVHLRDKNINAHLFVIGEGELRQDIERRISDLQLGSHVTLAGQRSDVPAWLNYLDFLVIPSKYEGLPLTLLEAMGVGRPVVATAVGGIPDVIEEGVDGLLVRPEDEAAMASVVLKLASSAELRQSLGQHARAKARANYSVQATARLYEQLYQHALAAP